MNERKLSLSITMFAKREISCEMLPIPAVDDFFLWYKSPTTLR